MKMSYYVWKYTTIVEVGSGCCKFAPARFDEMGSKRVVMITDKGLVKSGIVDKIKEVFESQGKPLAGIYDEIEQDAVLKSVNNCARWYREQAADGLLAVGGGSAMDTAKSVKGMIGLKAADIMQIITGNPELLVRPLAKPLGVPHIAIPTTAGTGSEVSWGSVVYLEDVKKKLTWRHDFLNANYALLDPDLTVSLPPQLTAETGFDALSHAVEGYFGPAANSMTEALALQVFRLVKKYLPLAVKDGGNIEARTQMLVASNMGVMSLALGGGAAPIHNFAHAMGAALRIPHGLGNAVFLPVVIKNLPSYYRPKVELFAQALGINTAKMSPDKMLAAAVLELVNLQKECGINPKFSNKVDAAQFETLFKAVKEDYVAMLFPLPDDVISACLKECFVVTP